MAGPGHKLVQAASAGIASAEAPVLQELVHELQSQLQATQGAAEATPEAVVALQVGCSLLLHRCRPASPDLRHVRPRIMLPGLSRLNIC